MEICIRVRGTIQTDCGCKVDGLDDTRIVEHIGTQQVRRRMAVCLVYIVQRAVELDKLADCGVSLVGIIVEP